LRRRFRTRSGRLWCRARSGSTGSGEGSREGSGEGSGEGLGGFGAEPGQVQDGFGEGSEKVWEALAKNQVRFNRVPEKVPEKFPAPQHASERFVKIKRCS